MRIVDFAVAADHRVKIKESEKRDKYSDLARKLKKKTVEHEGDDDTNCNWRARNNPQRLCKGTVKLRNQRKSGHHSVYSIINSQNTEKSPGSMKRFAVT